MLTPSHLLPAALLAVFSSVDPRRADHASDNDASITAYGSNQPKYICANRVEALLTRAIESTVAQWACGRSQFESPL